MRVGGQRDASSRIGRGCPRDFSVPRRAPMRSPPASRFRQGFGGGPQVHRRERDDSRSVARRWSVVKSAVSGLKCSAAQLVSFAWSVLPL
jgi:hypothetical protein